MIATESHRPLRILFVSHTFPPEDRPLASVGGMQRVAVDLHKTLEDRDDIQIDTCVLRSSWRWAYVRTPFFLVEALGQVRQALEQRAVDVVLFSSLICGVLAVPLERLLRDSGVKTVAIAHGLDALWSFPPYQWTLERAFTRLDAVVAVSAATGQACLDRGLDPAKLHIIPNGIDLKRFGNHPRPRRDQVFWGGRSLPSEAFLLCSVGRQVRRKGFPWFVDFASASRQRSDGLLSEKQAFIYRESPRRSSTPNRRLLNPTAAVDLCQSRLSGMTATIWIAPYPSYGRGKNKAIGRGIRLRKVRAAQVASEHGPSVSE